MNKHTCTSSMLHTHSAWLKHVHSGSVGKAVDCCGSALLKCAAALLSTWSLGRFQLRLFFGCWAYPLPMWLVYANASLASLAVGGTVVQWLALPHSKKVLGSNPPAEWGPSVWSLHLLVPAWVFLPVWVVVCLYMWALWLATCPGCTPLLTQ